MAEEETEGHFTVWRFGNKGEEDYVPVFEVWVGEDGALQSRLLDESHPNSIEGMLSEPFRDPVTRRRIDPTDGRAYLQAFRSAISRASYWAISPTRTL
jgi:hypothetical protein